MFGVSATNILDYLMKTDNIDPAHCASLLRGRAKEKADKIADAVEGFAMTDAQKTRVNIIQSHFTTIDELLARLDCEIAQLIAPFESQIALLCSIPGVDRDTAITIVSEIGTDMKQFSSSKRLCRWAGLTPGNNESAGKKKSVRITRAGVYLKPALVQAAHAAVKCTSQPYYRNKFERISKRRGKKRAIIAIARMILTAVFHMLSNGECFNPCDLANADVPDSIRKSRLLHSVRSAVDLLVTLGVVSSDNVCLSALVV
jgi:transposase